MKRSLIAGGAGMMAAALLAMHSQPAGLMPSRGVSTHTPVMESGVDAIGPRRKLSRKVRERQNRKARRARDVAHLHRKARRYSPPDPFMVAINKLTNWQRCRWQRAGRPGRKERDVSVVEAFVIEVRRARDRRNAGVAA